MNQAAVSTQISDTLDVQVLPLSVQEFYDQVLSGFSENAYETLRALSEGHDHTVIEVQGNELGEGGRLHIITDERVFTATNASPKDENLDVFLSISATGKHGIFTAETQGEPGTTEHHHKKAYFRAAIGRDKVISDFARVQGNLDRTIEGWDKGDEILPFELGHDQSVRFLLANSFGIEEPTKHDIDTVVGGLSVINGKLPLLMTYAWQAGFPSLGDIDLPPIDFLPFGDPAEFNSDQKAYKALHNWIRDTIVTRLEEREHETEGGPRHLLDRMINYALHDLLNKTGDEEAQFIGELPVKNDLNDEAAQATYQQNLNNALRKVFSDPGAAYDDLIRDLKNQLKDDVMAALVAGAETTSVTISGILQELAHNKTLQAELRAEINENRDEIYQPDGSINIKKLVMSSSDFLPKLNRFWDGVLKEHHPVPISLPRQIAEHITVGNVTLEPGDRFVVLNPALKNPFNAGAHNCAGQNQARMMYKTSTVRIADEVELSPGEGNEGIVQRRGSSFLGEPEVDLPVVVTPIVSGMG